MQGTALANWRAARSQRRADLAALACLIGVSLLPASGASAAQRPPTSLYWGAQIGSQMTGTAAPWDMSPVYRFEELAGKGLSLVELGTPFAECGSGGCAMTSFPDTPLESIRSYGAIPVLSWNSGSSPPQLVQPDFSLAAVSSGRYDAYIEEFARKAKEWGHPFFLRFNWEMNGFWFPWGIGVNGNSADQYVAAWRHVHDIFTAVGATNATWIWCPNVDQYGKLTPLRELYPGDEYVDWTGLDGFNWGKHFGSPGWQTFNQVFHRTYREVVTQIAPGKPMMLPEVASNDRGGDKPGWIRDMLDKLRHRYRKIRAVVWYDVDDRGTHWPIERRPQDGQAFRAGVRPYAYRPNWYGGIETSPIQPPQ